MVAAWRASRAEPLAQDLAVVTVLGHDGPVAGVRVVFGSTARGCSLPEPARARGFPKRPWVRCGPGPLVEARTADDGTARVPRMGLDVAMVQDGRLVSPPRRLGATGTTLTVVEPRRVVFAGARPAFAEVRSGVVDSLALPVPADGPMWVPVGAELATWGGGASWSSATASAKGKVTIRSQPIPVTPCVLSERPDEVFPCDAVPPTGDIDQRYQSGMNGRYTLHAPLRTLEVGEGQLLGVRLWIDAPDPVPPDPTRPTFSPASLFPSAAAARPDGSRGFTAHVRTGDLSELWVGEVHERPTYQQTTVSRRPRPSRVVQVIDDRGESVPFAVVPAWDPFLHQVESVVTDSAGQGVLPTDADGVAWVADAVLSPDWVPLAPTEARTVPSLPDPLPATRSIVGTWGTDGSERTITIHEDPVAVGEGLWVAPETVGAPGTLLIGTDGGLGVLGPAHGMSRYSLRPPPGPPAVSAFFPDLMHVHYTEIDVKKRAKVRYPPQARTEGDVKCLARVVIGPDGKPLAVRVEVCPTALHDAVSASLMKWSWYPYVRDGAPIAVQSVVGVVFEAD